ncbi:MAG: hypothetical protein JNL38_39910 [Myxococcales bacterium]|jgi:hypothetical protein|nr:hypothetical protein [Myxococcales bacterium]
MVFDPSVAKERLDRFWQLNAEFGLEHHAVHVYLSEIVSDRYVLVNGLQLIHDELQLAGLNQSDEEGDDVVACGADLSLPSVMTTLAHTNCGDRIHQGEATITYEQIVAARFAFMSEIGESKLEAFSPTGGGTDDGNTLAHVTVAHQLDAPIRKRFYEGNDKSFILVNIDLKTHVGRLDLHSGKILIGQTQESKWRESRSACGAVVGTLKSYNPENGVHRRIRADLGEANFEYLTKHGVKTKDGVDITPAVASAIVAIQGMENTAKALESELDDRGVGHLTASLTVNRPHIDDTIVYFARATVFGGETKTQGFGTDATKFSGRIMEYKGDRRLLMIYDGVDASEHKVRTETYTKRH